MIIQIKKILITSFLFLMGLISFSQKSLIKNKLAIEYDLGVPPLTNNLYIDMIDKIQLAKYFNSVYANYKVASKIAVSFGVGFHRYNLANTPSDIPFYMRGKEIDLGLKFFFRNARAPLGNSIDVYFKRQSFKINIDELVNYVGDDFRLNKTLIGIKLNRITMISSKSSLYVKYSASIYLPIVSNSVIPEFANKNNKPSYYDLFGISDYSVIDDYRNVNLFQLHIGVGYAF